MEKKGKKIIKAEEQKVVKITTPQTVKTRLYELIQNLNALERKLNNLRRSQQDIINTLLATKEIVLNEGEYLDLDNNLNILIKQRKNEQK